MSTLAEVQFHIYPTDCDMLGHLNHATMLNFLERARWALLEPQIDVENGPSSRSSRSCATSTSTISRSHSLARISSFARPPRRAKHELHREAGGLESGPGHARGRANIVFVTIGHDGQPVRVPDSGARCSRSGRSGPSDRLVDGARIAYDDIGAGAGGLSSRVSAEPHDVGAADRAPSRASGAASRSTCGASVSRRRLRRSPWIVMPTTSSAILDTSVSQRPIVGLSMGGYVAFALWRRAPDRVRALVLADTRATADSPDAAERRRELIALARSDGAPPSRPAARRTPGQDDARAAAPKSEAMARVITEAQRTTASWVRSRR